MYLYVNEKVCVSERESVWAEVSPKKFHVRERDKEREYVCERVCICM